MQPRILSIICWRGVSKRSGGLLDGLKKALADRALNAEMDHHLSGPEGAGNRGVEEVRLAVVDGQKGFPEAILAVFPEATVQTCIVHLLRHSLDFTAYKDRKAVATALKDIYRAPDAVAAEKGLAAFEEGEWGRRYAAIGQSWRRA